MAVQAITPDAHPVNLVFQSWRYGPRHFRLVAERPYVNRQGERRVIGEWRGSCVVCGAPFVVSAPRGGEQRTKAFGQIRCDEHKRPTNRRP